MIETNPLGVRSTSGQAPFFTSLVHSILSLYHFSCYSGPFIWPQFGPHLALFCVHLDGLPLFDTPWLRGVELWLRVQRNGCVFLRRSAIRILPHP